MIIYDLLINFLIVGIFTFGSGYSAIPLIKDVVLTNHWMTEEAYLNIVAIAESTPGPIMVNVATYVGYTQAGLIGGILSTSIAVLPAFIVILIFTKYFRHYLTSNKAQFVFSLVRPALCAVIFSTGIELLFKSTIKIFSVNEIMLYGISIFQDIETIKRMIILILLLLIIIIYKKIFKKDIKTIPYIIVSAIVGIIVLS